MGETDRFIEDLESEIAALRVELEAAKARERTVVVDALGRATAYQRRAHRAERFLSDLDPIRLLGRLPEYHALMEKALTDFDSEVAAIKRELQDAIIPETAHVG